MHRDHYTQAALVREECGDPIALSAGERASLEMYLEGGGAHILAAWPGCGRAARASWLTP